MSSSSSPSPSSRPTRVRRAPELWEEQQKRRLSEESEAKKKLKIDRDEERTKREEKKKNAGPPSPASLLYQDLMGLTIPQLKSLLSLNGVLDHYGKKSAIVKKVVNFAQTGVFPSCPQCRAGDLRFRLKGDLGKRTGASSPTSRFVCGGHWRLVGLGGPNCRMVWMACAYGTNEAKIKKMVGLEQFGIQFECTTEERSHEERKGEDKDKQGDEQMGDGEVKEGEEEKGDEEGSAENDGGEGTAEDGGEGDGKKPEGSEECDDGAVKPSSSPSSSSTDSNGTLYAGELSYLSGLNFMIMGGFNQGKFRVESWITDLGGSIKTAPSKSLSFVVCGYPVNTDYGGVSGMGSKKYREAKKMKLKFMDENEFDAFKKKIEENKESQKRDLDTALPPVLSDIVDQYEPPLHEVANDWNEILDILQIDRKGLNPATDESIKRLEETMKRALPGYLKALLKIQDGEQTENDHPIAMFPSVSTLSDAWRCFPETWRRNAMLPFSDLNDGVQIDLMERNGNGDIVDLDFEYEFCIRRSKGIPQRIRGYLELLREKKGAVSKGELETHWKDTGVLYAVAMKERALWDKLVQGPLNRSNNKPY